MVDCQLVAFPQSGVCGAQVGACQLLRLAVVEGLADAVGGLDPLGIDGGLDELEVVLTLAAGDVATVGKIAF